ncbi:MAG TPA: hypothetical protein VI956_07895 [Nitrospirota bacterium]|jgi:hypothetical protein|nr:hypothetical protein [Nitrospirota bacterium]
MVSPKQLISPSKLKTKYLASFSGHEPFFFFYDNEADELVIMLISPDTETTVHYVDKNVGILFQPDNLEIVGLQVEGFQKSFIPSHNSLQDAWKLSSSKGVPLDNLGDLSMFIREKQITFALKVIRASKPVLGKPAKKLEEALEYA